MPAGPVATAAWWRSITATGSRPATGICRRSTSRLAISSRPAMWWAKSARPAARPARICIMRRASMAKRSIRSASCVRARGSLRADRLLAYLILATKSQMHGARCRDMLADCVAERRKINPVKKSFAATQQNRRNSDLQIVDQPRAKILADRCHAAANPNVLAAGRLSRTVKCRLDPVRYEMEDGTALHRDRRTCVVGQDKNRTVIRRLVAPPSLPCLIRPSAANGAEHVAPHDPRAEILTAHRGLIVVRSGCSAVLPKYLFLECAWAQRPLMQAEPTNTERGIETLVRASTITIERDREAAND